MKILHFYKNLNIVDNGISEVFKMNTAEGNE